MNDKTLELLATLASKMGTTVTNIHALYTQWHFAAALTALGVAGAIVGVVIYIHEREVIDDEAIRFAITALLALISLLLVGEYLPTLLAPEAMAWHELLKDLK